MAATLSERHRGRSLNLAERHRGRSLQRGKRISRPAFTLLEMLIAMALTLIMVGAIAQFYAYVGETVKDARAMIELNGHMRAAIQRLKTDLDCVTAQAIPWADEGSGYLSIFEGLANDSDADGNGALDTTQLANWTSRGVSNLIGDGDDALSLTIRASSEPLTGRYYDTLARTHKIITAQHAEVVWWTGFTDIAPPGAAANGVWDLEEPRQVYRRQLLIRPDLGLLQQPDPMGGPPAPITFPANQSGYTQAITALIHWFQVSDVSASIRVEAIGSNQVIVIRANSLADLSRREYRFGCLPYDPTTLAPNFPYPLSLAVRSAASAGITPLTSVALQNVSVFPNTSYATTSTSEGEDIVLSNALALDIRVYDPQAIVRADATTAAAASLTLTPLDPGYVENIRGVLGGTMSLYPAVGSGAFVDLGYASTLEYLLNSLTPGTLGNPPPATGTSLTTFRNYFGDSHFARQSRYLPQLGRTWDTWTWWYERDGLNQDNDRDSNGQPLIDEGTDGLDNLVQDPNNPSSLIYLNGVDDADEREAPPPYARVLRGLEVRIRLYEPGTRQARQATVGADFVAE